VPHVALDAAALVAADADVDLAALDDAMTALARVDPRKMQVVEMRFFGLSVEETAEVLGISPVTVKRDWRMAKAWLYRELADGINGWTPNAGNRLRIFSNRCWTGLRASATRC
jgi:RNA polymerase sigma-70 factor, ECF subfamily